MNPDLPEIEKCAIVVDAGLPLGLAINAAAVLALSLGRCYGDAMVGDDVKDADGASHRGLTSFPVPVLKAADTTVRDIVLRAHERTDVFVVDFAAAAQAARDYGTYQDGMLAAGTAEHGYAGVAVAGARKAVNKLTGSLPLFG